MTPMTGFRVSPSGVSEYSTFGGTWRWIFRLRMPWLFEFAELLRKCPVRYAGECAVEFAESFGAAEQFLQNQHFPAAADDFNRGFDGTADGFLWHRRLLGNFLVTNAQKSAFLLDRAYAHTSTVQLKSAEG